MNQQAIKTAPLKKLHSSNMKLLNKDELQTAEAVLLKHLPKSFKVDGHLKHSPHVSIQQCVSTCASLRL